MELFDEMMRLVRLFHEEQVDYAVCGGMAMALHGFVRATEDIDLIVESDSLPRLRKLAARCGFRLLGPDLQFESGIRVLRLVKVTPDSEDYLVLDFLLVGAETLDAWNSRHAVATPSGPVYVVSRPALKAMKLATGRTQDKADVERLDNPDDNR